MEQPYSGKIGRALNLAISAKKPFFFICRIINLTIKVMCIIIIILLGNGV